MKTGKAQEVLVDPPKTPASVTPIPLTSITQLKETFPTDFLSF
jgi:hypothetical protein